MKAGTTTAVALCLALASVPCALLGQVATVTSEDGRVVADGDFVRIEGLEGVTEVRGDWRRGGTVTVTDTDSLLVELGAVRAEDHIHLNLAGDILFEFGSALVTEAAEEVLTKVAHVIRERALGDVLLVGHTDSIGDDASNQRLSEERALEVIRWLQIHEGIPSEVLVGRGMGERQPVAHNKAPGGGDNPTGRARNRRVELFLGTTAQADVRAAAGLVTVRSAEGEVRIREDSVEVDDLVRVDQGGVQVGGVTVAAATGTTTASTSCAAGRRCRQECPLGDCSMTCPAGAICDFSCRGGDCEMFCSAGATCDFGCTGGDCHFSCAMGSNCDTSCAGGECYGG